MFRCHGVFPFGEEGNMLDVNAAWDEVLLRLSVAAACGAVLGWDREARAKPAGLRTNILVSMGAALFAIVGIELSTDVRADGGSASDPVKVIDGIVGGVGFLGAATVFRSRRGVEGVTTAAAIWLMAAIGATCGIGAYQTALTATAIALFTLTVLGFMEAKWKIGSPSAKPATPLPEEEGTPVA
jgi:putative Mg2+ transporter-C (MgtC) family protein